VREDEIKTPDSLKTGASPQGDVGHGGGTRRIASLLRDILPVNPESASKAVDANGESLVL